MIFLRQLELGITKGLPLLWVDDHILEENAEMKAELYDAQKRRSQDHVIKFILKPSTDLAMAYLRSPFGRCHLAHADSKLRILSDMSRRPEEDGRRAGAHFVKKLQDESLSNFPVMIFTGDRTEGRRKLEEVGVAEVDAIYVTDDSAEAVRFASWEARELKRFGTGSPATVPGCCENRQASTDARPGCQVQ